MAKKIDGYIKLQIKAGQANPAPPIGPALGQHGVSIMEFCKQFNAATQDRMGLVLPVVKSPPAAILLKKAANIDRGAGDPLRQKVGHVTWDDCRAIAEQKMEDLNAFDLDKAAAMIAGTARSMGLIVDGRPEEV